MHQMFRSTHMMMKYQKKMPFQIWTSSNRQAGRQQAGRCTHIIANLFQIWLYRQVSTHTHTCAHTCSAEGVAVA